MRRILFALLFFATNAWPHVDLGPNFTVGLATEYLIDADTARFRSWLNHDESYTSVYALTNGVDFGDGQSFTGAGFGITVDHDYAPGSYAARMRYDAVGTFTWFTYDANGMGTPHLSPIDWHYETTFNIDVAGLQSFAAPVSHAPEPGTFAMIGFGLLMLAAFKRRKQEDVDGYRLAVERRCDWHGIYNRGPDWKLARDL